MWDALCLEGQKSQDLLHGAAWFAFGVALAACGWFSATTAIEGLRQLVPAETALFAAIGLQAGVVSSAYFFARLTRRRIYWLGAYLLISGTVVAFSYLGIHQSPTVGDNRSPAGAPATVRPVLQELLALRHPHPAEALQLAIAGAFVLIPLLGLMGTRPESDTLPMKCASLRRNMKDIAEQVESTEGLFTWAGRMTAAAFFNRPKVDQRASDFQAQVRVLRESVQDALVSIDLPSFLHERLSMRLLDMCSDMETLAFATQTRFDRQRLAGLNDCLDAVQSSELSQTLKDEARALLLDHFNQYHTAARRLTRAESLRDTTLGRELSENAENA
jgi:hypothetical protein